MPRQYRRRNYNLDPETGEVREPQQESTVMVPGDNPLPIPPEVVMPSDAEPLKAVIDRRFKHLLSTSMDPKDMTKALEAAIKWYEATNDKQQQWGADLGRSTLS